MWFKSKRVAVAPSSEAGVRAFRHSILSGADDSVVYLCGPHGSGKSTLIEDLKSASLAVEVRDQLGHMEGLQDNLSRQVWRITLHAIEHRENLAAVTEKRAIILGDRCYVDDEAYVAAFVSLGWMKAGEEHHLKDLTTDTYRFLQINPPKNFIILLPPIAWNIERIMARWEAGEKTKWQETDFNYLAHVLDAYRLKATTLSGRTLVITDTDRNVRVSCVRRWFNGNQFIKGKAWVEGLKRQQEKWPDSN